MEQDDIAVAHLVEHTDHMTLAKGGTLGGLHRTDIRNVTVVANGIVVDEIAYLLDQTVVANSDVAQRGIVDTGMLGEALGHFDLLLKLTQTDVTIEDDTMEAVRGEGLVNHHAFPTLGPTTVVLEHVNFLLC